MSSRYSVEAIFKAIDRFTAPVTAMQNRIGKFTRYMESRFRAVDRVISRTASSMVSLGKSALKWGTVGITAVATATLGVIKEFSRIENARAAFTPLLGGVDKAKQLVADLNQLMVDTPFEFDHLTDAAKQLLPVMNGDIAKTVETIKMLGDTAGGNAQSLESITRGFTKAMLKGKVDLEALNMIAEAGVPIFTELAATMGKEVGPAFFKMISAGKVTTAQLTQAFQRMTSEGGIFFNGMKIASVTTSALWSGFMDNVRSTAAVIGEELDPYVKELLGYMTTLTQRLRTWITANREFIQTKLVEYVGRLKVGFENFINAMRESRGVGNDLQAIWGFIKMIARGIAWIAGNWKAVVKLVKWIGILAITFKALHIAMAIFNLLAIANPFGLIVVGIAAAIAAISALLIWFDDIKAWFNGLPGWVQFSLNLLVLPFHAIMGLIDLLKRAWDLFGEDIKDVWKGIGDFIMTVFDKIKPIFNAVKDFHVGLINLGQKFWTNVLGLDEDENRTPETPQVLGPEARSAHMIQESHSSSTAELLIRDTTGRAELTKRGEAPGISFSMVPTGAF